MGVLYARVGAAWVPITSTGPASQQSFVISPAEAGPRTDNTVEARFGNVGVADKSLGFIAQNPASSMILNGYNLALTLWDHDVSGTSYRKFGHFDFTKTTLNNFSVGTGVHGSTYCSVWQEPYTASNEYTALINGSGGQLFLNARSNVYMRIANVDLFTFGATGLSMYQKLWCQAVEATGQLKANRYSYNWYDAGLHCRSNDADPATMVLCSSWAPQQRVVQVSGERYEFMNSLMSLYIPLRASGFEVSSSLTMKRDVRLLRPERERIVVRHDPMVDTVPAPDIMALRPVAFRPEGELPRRYTDPDDPDVWEHPAPDSSFGVQATRERLGLIAEEVQHVIPCAVSYDADGAPKAIDYAQITVALLDHVQQLTETVATLKYRIAELEAR